MTDRYEKIRKALAMGPTPGPWNLKDGRTDTVENAQGYPVCTVHWHPDERYGHGTRAAYIAACDPDTIRALLDEREALRAEVDALRLNDASVQPELVAVALAACDAVDDLIEKWYATHESGCLPNQVVRARGASKLLRAIALENSK